MALVYTKCDRLPKFSDCRGRQKELTSLAKRHIFESQRLLGKRLKHGLDEFQTREYFKEFAVSAFGNTEGHLAPCGLLEPFLWAVDKALLVRQDRRKRRWKFAFWAGVVAISLLLVAGIAGVRSLIAGAHAARQEMWQKVNFAVRPSEKIAARRAFLESGWCDSRLLGPEQVAEEQKLLDADIARQKSAAQDLLDRNRNDYPEVSSGIDQHLADYEHEERRDELIKRRSEAQNAWFERSLKQARDAEADTMLPYEAKISQYQMCLAIPGEHNREEPNRAVERLIAGWDRVEYKMLRDFLNPIPSIEELSFQGEAGLNLCRTYLDGPLPSRKMSAEVERCLSYLDQLVSDRLAYRIDLDDINIPEGSKVWSWIHPEDTNVKITYDGGAADYRLHLTPSSLTGRQAASQGKTGRGPHILQIEFSHPKYPRGAQSIRFDSLIMERSEWSQRATLTLSNPTEPPLKPGDAVSCSIRIRCPALDLDNYRLPSYREGDQ
jgi:hypothetical protein